MRNTTKKLVAAVVAFTTSVSLCLHAGAGQNGFSAGGGMSMRSMGGSSMSRSMGGNLSSRSMGSGMSVRSMGGMSSNLSSRSTNLPRGMPGGSFSSAARSMGGNMSRNPGGSSLGGVRSPVGSIGNSVRNVPTPGGMISKSPITTTRPDLGRVVGKQLDSRLNKAFDRGAAGNLTKGNLGNLVGRGAVKDLGNGKLGNSVGSKDLAGRTGNIIAGSLKSGRIRTGDLAKIDRSKLRDLVRGIEAGKGGAGGLLPTGGSKTLDPIVKGFDKAKLAGAIHAGGLKPFHPGNPLGGKAGFKNGFASKSAGLLAAAGFHHHGHHHHHHHHGHWFDFVFGDFWFDDHYDYPHYDHCHYEPHYYDSCWYPVYTYPACGVTFTAYPEVVTLAAAQPITVDQEITLVSTSEELETAKPIVEEELLEEIDELSAMFGGSAVDTADESAKQATVEESSAEEATEKASEETSVDATAGDAAIAETRTSETTAVDPTVQSDMDLELIDVQMVDAGNREAKLGPSFKVTVRNTGKRNLERFLVSLVACKDTAIDSSSVHASTTVDELAAGAETSISVTLPAEAMSLNRDSQGRLAPYNTLVAAVDSDERIGEGNEENNLALIDRTSIKLANK
jgi:hypothetical protein